MKPSFRSTLVIILIFCFSGCDSLKTKSSEEASSNIDVFLQKGDSITTATQKELLKNVSAAMQTGGPVYAIEFCNTRAVQLTDSLSQKYNCTIERLSLKNRNPHNFPDSEDEKHQLTFYANQHEEGKIIEPKVVYEEEKVMYYKPITIGMETCLKCHGTTENGLTEKTRNLLAELYPNGKATGYQLGDFRGVWKVTFYR